jgi:hypothetical protein
MFIYIIVNCIGFKALEVHRGRTKHAEGRHQDAGEEMAGYL